MKKDDNRHNDGSDNSTNSFSNFIMGKEYLDAVADGRKADRDCRNAVEDRRRAARQADEFQQNAADKGIDVREEFKRFGL